MGERKTEMQSAESVDEDASQQVLVYLKWPPSSDMQEAQTPSPATLQLALPPGAVVSFRIRCLDDVLELYLCLLQLGVTSEFSHVLAVFIESLPYIFVISFASWFVWRGTVNTHRVVGIQEMVFVDVWFDQMPTETMYLIPTVPVYLLVISNWSSFTS